MSQSTTKNGPKRPPRGTYPVKVDSTGRLKFPSAYKEYLDSLDEKEIFVTVIFGMIRGYTGTSWEQELIRLDAKPLVKKAIWEDGDRFGQDVTPDSHGRATLPQKVRDEVHVEDTTLQMRFHGEAIWMYTEEQHARMAAKNDANRESVKAEAEELGFV